MADRPMSMIGKLAGGSSRRPASPVQGSSRQAGDKWGGDRTEVPSDESDEDRIQRKRPRVRQRQRTRPIITQRKRRPSGSVVMSPFQEKMMELTLARRPSSSVSIETSSPVKIAEIQTDDNENATPMQANTVTTPVRGTPMQASRATTPVRGNVGEGSIIAGPSGSPSGRHLRRNLIGYSNPRLLRRSSVMSVNGEHGWTLFSLWVPSWKAKLQCNNGSKPVEPKEFGNLLLEVVESVSPFITYYKHHELKLMQVHSMKEDGHGNAEIMMKRYQASQAETGSIRLKSSDVRVANIIGKLVSVDDIILHFKQNSNEEHVPGVIIHLTTRNSDAGIIKNPRNSVTFQNIVLNIHDSSGLPYPFNWEKLLEISSMNFQWPGHSKEERISEPSSNSNSDAESSNSNGSSDGGSGPRDVIVLDSDDDDDEDELMPSRECNRSIEFNLNRFPPECVFLPGPMRPKVRKEKGNNYAYHKLSELAEMLNSSLDKDSKNKNPICGLIKEHCHTYGIVVKRVKEHRDSENSYRIRIADETMNSVLVRLHTKSVVGPAIKVGDIIRIHRLTVQIEYDPDHDDNTMVLSTAQHINYVLFREASETESTFNYHTCAKSITLCDFDSIRVGEMSHFKKNNISGNRQPEVVGILPTDLPRAQHNHNLRSVGLAKVTDNGQVCEVSSTCGAEGMYLDDLESPHISDVSVIENSDPELSPELFSDAQNNISDPHGSNSDSDDSFVTADTSPIRDLQDVNQDPVDDLSLSLSFQNLEETLQSGASLHLGRRISQSQEAYTCFMNLKKNGSNPTLLCTIADLLSTSEKNVCHLIIKDGESTLPVEDFKNRDFLGEQRGDSHLVLNITNARKLVDRGIFSEWFEALGADELYIIENVEIQGENPPYSLQVNGETCVIRLATYEDLSRNLNQTFTFDTQLSGSGAILGSMLSRREEIALNGSIDEPTADDDDVYERNNGARNGSGAGPSSSPNPDTTRNDGKPWDGKVTTRRMRRHHYQNEDALEC